MTQAAAPKHTERSLSDLLAKRYGEMHGNGAAWAYMPQVRNAAGFDATRTCDAVAMALWPSRGLEIHGHEIKCSRSDWVAELRDPSKAEAFTVWCDRWWLVVADKAIVKDGELPPDWGLMAVQGGKLVVQVQAPLLVPNDIDLSNVAPSMFQSVIREHRRQLPAKFSRSVLAALLRAATKAGLEADRNAFEVEVAKRVADEKGHYQAQLARYEERAREQEARIRAFEQAAGVRLGYLPDADAPSWQASGHTPTEVGAALRRVLNGDEQAEQLAGRFKSLAQQADRLAAEARRAAGIDETES